MLVALRQFSRKLIVLEFVDFCRCTQCAEGDRKNGEFRNLIVRFAQIAIARKMLDKATTKLLYGDINNSLKLADLSRIPAPLTGEREKSATRIANANNAK